MVRSTDVDVVLRASQRVGELVSAGVVLSSSKMGAGFAGPTFLFTKLNDLKPAMIADATASARQAAEQFASDSRSRLGGIRQASQGVFVILPRDQAPGIQEPMRVRAELRRYLVRLQALGLASADFDSDVASAMLTASLFTDAMGRDLMPECYPYTLEEAPTKYVDLFLRVIGARSSNVESNLQPHL